MSFSLLAHTSTFGTNGGTTSAINTTGANLIVLVLSSQGAVMGTFSDSQGNTYINVTDEPASSGSSQIWYCSSPSTSASHTFTVSGANLFAWMGVMVFSGAKSTSAADQHNVNRGSGTTIQPGSVTGTQSPCLVIASVCTEAAGTLSIDSSFAITDQKALVGSVNYTGAAAWLVQPTATAVNPTWTSTSSASLSATQVTFLPPGSTSQAMFGKSAGGGKGRGMIAGFPSVLFGKSRAGGKGKLSFSNQVVVMKGRGGAEGKGRAFSKALLELVGRGSGGSSARLSPAKFLFSLKGRGLSASFGRLTSKASGTPIYTFTAFFARRFYILPPPAPPPEPDYRVTMDGSVRITQDGDTRILEEED